MAATTRSVKGRAMRQATQFLTPHLAVALGVCSDGSVFLQEMAGGSLPSCMCHGWKVPGSNLEV